MRGGGGGGAPRGLRAGSAGHGPQIAGGGTENHHRRRRRHRGCNCRRSNRHRHHRRVRQRFRRRYRRPNCNHHCSCRRRRRHRRHCLRGVRPSEQASGGPHFGADRGRGRGCAGSCRPHACRFRRHHEVAGSRQARYGAPSNAHSLRRVDLNHRRRRLRRRRVIARASADAATRCYAKGGHEYGWTMGRNGLAGPRERIPNLPPSQDPRGPARESRFRGRDRPSRFGRCQTHSGWLVARFVCRGLLVGTEYRIKLHVKIGIECGGAKGEPSRLCMNHIRKPKQLNVSGI